MIRLDSVLKSRLKSNQVGCMQGGSVRLLPIETTFEPPCSIKGATIRHSFRLGAFSYCVSGYFFAVRIGRYCSIAEDVQIGRHSHPISNISTSPLFYRSIGQVLDISPEEDDLSGEFCRDSPPFNLKPVAIHNDVYIGHGAFIMPGVSIGNGAVIGAMSVVTKNVDPYTIVAGNPARVIRERFDPKTIELLLKLNWWNYAPSSLSGLNPTNVGLFISELQKMKESSSITPYKPCAVELKHFLDSKNATP